MERCPRGDQGPGWPPRSCLSRTLGPPAASRAAPPSRDGGSRRPSVLTPAGEGLTAFGSRLPSFALHRERDARHEEEHAVRGRRDLLVRAAERVLERAPEGRWRHDAEPDLVRDDDESGGARRAGLEEAADLGPRRARGLLLRGRLPERAERVRDEERQAVDEDDARPASLLPDRPPGVPRGLERAPPGRPLRAVARDPGGHLPVERLRGRDEEDVAARAPGELERVSALPAAGAADEEGQAARHALQPPQGLLDRR